MTCENSESIGCWHRVARSKAENYKVSAQLASCQPASGTIRSVQYGFEHTGTMSRESLLFSEGSGEVLPSWSPEPPFAARTLALFPSATDPCWVGMDPKKFCIPSTPPAPIPGDIKLAIFSCLEETELASHSPWCLTTLKENTYTKLIGKYWLLVSWVKRGYI